MFYVFLFVAGLAVGSFLNVVIDRLPHGKSLLGRSYCDFCKKQLAAGDLFPVFSFLAIRGYSRCCKHKLSWYYPVVELVTAYLFILAWGFIPASGIYQLLYLGIISCLIVIFFTDLKYQIIPDEILIVLLLFSAPFFLLDVKSHALGAVALFAFFQLIHSVTRGRGMGYGDVKFAGVIGFLQGLARGAFSVYGAFVLGGIVGISLILLRIKKRKSAIPFGPFLVLGFFIMLFFEKQIFAFTSLYFYPLP